MLLVLTVDQRKLLERVERSSIKGLRTSPASAGNGEIFRKAPDSVHKHVTMEKGLFSQPITVAFDTMGQKWLDHCSDVNRHFRAIPSFLISLPLTPSLPESLSSYHSTLSTKVWRSTRLEIPLVLFSGVQREQEKGVVLVSTPITGEEWSLLVLPLSCAPWTKLLLSWIVILLPVTVNM